MEPWEALALPRLEAGDGAASRCRVSPISSRPSRSFCRLPGSTVKGIGALPRGRRISSDSRSIVKVGVFRRLGLARQEVDLRLRQDDRQDAVLEAVVEEDVGEGGGDHAGDAEVEKGPGGVLSAAAAAEILARDRDLRTSPGLTIEDEIQRFLPISASRTGLEQAHPELGALDGIQPMRRDDLVGVDIGQRQGCGDAGEGSERLRGCRPWAGNCGLLLRHPFIFGNARRGAAAVRDGASRRGALKRTRSVDKGGSCWD